MSYNWSYLTQTFIDFWMVALTKLKLLYLAAYSIKFKFLEIVETMNKFNSKLGWFQKPFNGGCGIL